MRPLTIPADAAPQALAGDTIQPARPDPMQAAATQAAPQFESHFIGQMLHEMRRSSRTLSDEGEQPRSGDDMLDLADTLVADQLARQGAFGIADLLLRQVMPSASQEFKAGPAPVASSAVKP